MKVFLDEFFFAIWMKVYLTLGDVSLPEWARATRMCPFGFLPLFRIVFHATLIISRALNFCRTLYMIPLFLVSVPFDLLWLQQHHRSAFQLVFP